MQPIIRNCYYKSNVSDTFAQINSLESVPEQFPDSFCVDSGKVQLIFTAIALYLGTGLLRSKYKNKIIAKESETKFFGCVAYNSSFPEYITLTFSERQSKTNCPSKFYALQMKTKQNKVGEDYLEWFVQLLETGNQTVQFVLNNKLGTKGSFKVDSDNNGLADGWFAELSCNHSIRQIEGKKWQYLACNGPSCSIWTQFDATPNDVYFISMNQLAITNDIDCRSMGRTKIADYENISSWIQVIPVFPYDKTGFSIKRAGITKAPSSKVYLRIETTSQDSIPGLAYELLLSQVAVYNLSEMNYLPELLQKYLGRLKWVDLVTENVIHALDGREKTGYEWLNELLSYAEDSQQVSIQLDSPFSWVRQRYYKTYIFKYDNEYKEEVLISDVQITTNNIVEVSYEYPWRKFTKTFELPNDNKINHLELVALLDSVNNGVMFSNVFSSQPTTASITTNEYAFFEKEKQKGIWYYDRANQKARIYSVREIMFIHKDRMDKLGEDLDIDDIYFDRIYITPFTYSREAIIFLPEVQDDLKRARLSETIWKVVDSRFVIDSTYWYSLYINLLEELSGPNDDSYEIINGVYVKREGTVNRVKDLFKVVYEGGNWNLKVDRTKLPGQSEELYCMLKLYDIFDNTDTTFVFVSGYSEYKSRYHKDWNTSFRLKKNRFAMNSSYLIIPLSQYLTNT